MPEPFHWAPEHEEFRAVLRKVTDRAVLADAPGPAAAEAREREQWRAWTEELGLPGLVVPEEHGGAGFSRLELAIAAEELGRAVLGGPLFASAVLATEALHGVPVRRALGHGERGDRGAGRERGQHLGGHRAGSTVSGDRLTGVKQTVLGAGEADLLVVAAREDVGVSLFLVEPDPGVAVEPLTVLDPTRPVARVRLTGAPGRRVGAPGSGRAAVERALEAGAVFLAAEQVGGSRALLDLAVEHATTRVQFGRPIGAFQAVKHRLADMAVRTELGSAAAFWAAWQEPGSNRARLGAAVARAHCAEAYLETALDAIQVHGGMAITWEHHAHRFLRRARADLAVLPGPSAQHRFLESVIGTGV